MTNYLHKRGSQYESSLITDNDGKTNDHPPIEEIKSRVIDEVLKSDLAGNCNTIKTLESIGILPDVISALVRHKVTGVVNSHMPSVPIDGAKRVPKERDKEQNKIRDSNVDSKTVPFNYDAERIDEGQVASILFSVKEEQKFGEIRSSLDRVVYSLIRTSDPSISRELYFQILENNDAFGRLASEYSEGPEKYTRGIIGPVGSDQGHPEITRYLKSAEKGKPSKPFAVGGWWVILRLEAVIESVLNKETRTSISQMMYYDWAEDIANTTTEMIRQRYVDEQ